VANGPFSGFEAFATVAGNHLGEAASFVATLGLQRLLILDHICFKCRSSEEFDSVRSILERNPPSDLLHQVMLAGRRVAYFRLADGFDLGETVRYVELCDRKPAADDSFGFHHVEVYPSGQIPYEALLNRLTTLGLQVRLKSRPHHTTHDWNLASGLVMRLTDKPLIRKIMEEELNSRADSF
jgi:predicted metalloenzyme YecM